MKEQLPIKGLGLARSERVIHLWSENPLHVVSSAVVGADLTRARHVLNMRVDNEYSSLAPWVDLTAMARELGIREPFVGLMTAARLERAGVVVERDAQVAAAAFASVGISRPVAAGVTEVVQTTAPGTINIILALDANLSVAAAVNAVITVTEAKTLALVEAGVRAPHGGPASGTATDAVVVASTGRGPLVEFTGPVAPAGALIARTVRQAVQQALLSWPA